VSGAITLASLADRDVWVGWRTEARDGRATKIPFDPRTGQPAKSDDSRSWATCREAEFWAIKERGDGVGIMSCPVGDASLAAVDLDACRNTDTGDIAPCAQEIIDRLGTYAEVSPSGTGVTAFFAIANADLSPSRSSSRASTGAPSKMAAAIIRRRSRSIEGAAFSQSPKRRSGRPTSCGWSPLPISDG
jgi:hypothetical protein